MAKNIEININTSGTYEVLYPKVDLTNNNGTTLSLSSTSGNLDNNRVTNSIKYKTISRTGTGGKITNYIINTGVTINNIFLLIVCPSNEIPNTYEYIQEGNYGNSSSSIIDRSVPNMQNHFISIFNKDSLSYKVNIGDMYATSYSSVIVRHLKIQIQNNNFYIQLTNTSNSSHATFDRCAFNVTNTVYNWTFLYN